MRPARAPKAGQGFTSLHHEWRTLGQHEIDLASGCSTACADILPRLADRTQGLPDGWLRISPGLACWARSHAASRSPESRAGARCAERAYPPFWKPPAALLFGVVLVLLDVSRRDLCPLPGRVPDTDC